MSEGLTPLCAKVARFPIYRTKNDTGCTRRAEGEAEGVTESGRIDNSSSSNARYVTSIEIIGSSLFLGYYGRTSA